MFFQKNYLTKVKKDVIIMLLYKYIKTMYFSSGCVYCLPYVYYNAHTFLCLKIKK